MKVIIDIPKNTQENMKNGFMTTECFEAIQELKKKVD